MSTIYQRQRHARPRCTFIRQWPCIRQRNYDALIRLKRPRIFPHWLTRRLSPRMEPYGCCRLQPILSCAWPSWCLCREPCHELRWWNVFFFSFLRLRYSVFYFLFFVGPYLIIIIVTSFLLLFFPYHHPLLFFLSWPYATQPGGFFKTRSSPLSLCKKKPDYTYTLV